MRGVVVQGRNGHHTRTIHHRFIRIVLGLCIFILVGWFAAFPPSASANTEDITVKHSTTFIAKDQTVRDVVVIGHDATIAGTVTDNLFVINGNIHIASNAHVGAAIDLGGRIDHETNAHVGDFFTLSFTNQILNKAVLDISLTAILWILWLLVSVATVLIPVLVTIALRARIHTPSSYLDVSVRRMGIIGLLASIGFSMIVVILSATMIGLPLAALVLLAYACAGLIGLAVLSTWIGKSIANKITQEKRQWVQSLTGATLMMTAINIPLLGSLLLFLFWLIGVGTVTTWTWQTIQHRRSKGGQR